MCFLCNVQKSGVLTLRRTIYMTNQIYQHHRVQY